MGETQETGAFHVRNLIIVYFFLNGEKLFFIMDLR